MSILQYHLNNSLQNHGEIIFAFIILFHFLTIGIQF